LHGILGFQHDTENRNQIEINRLICHLFSSYMPYYRGRRIFTEGTMNFHDQKEPYVYFRYAQRGVQIGITLPFKDTLYTCLKISYYQVVLKSQSSKGIKTYGISQQML